MHLIDATRNCLKQSFDFKTRSRRSEFWGFILTSTLTCFLLGFFDKLVFGTTWPISKSIKHSFRDGEMITVGQSYSLEIISGPISQICAVLLIIPIVSAMVRRLHDTGRAGWTLLLPFLLILLLNIVIRILIMPLFWLLVIIYIATIIWIIVLLFKDSDYSNKYGIGKKYPQKGVSNPMLDK